MTPFAVGISLGVLIGFAIAVLIVATLAFFKKAIMPHIEIVEQKLENAGPQRRGFIVEPESDADEAREEHYEKNRREGRDTPISELR